MGYESGRQVDIWASSVLLQLSEAVFVVDQTPNVVEEGPVDSMEDLFVQIRTVIVLVCTGSEELEGTVAGYKGSRVVGAAYLLLAEVEAAMLALAAVRIVAAQVLEHNGWLAADLTAEDCRETAL